MTARTLRARPSRRKTSSEAEIGFRIGGLRANLSARRAGREHSPALEALGLSWPQIIAYAEAVAADGDRAIDRMVGHPNLLQPPKSSRRVHRDVATAANRPRRRCRLGMGDVRLPVSLIDRDDLATGRFDGAVLHANHPDPSTPK